jgi:hypothetical protein
MKIIAKNFKKVQQQNPLAAAFVEKFEIKESNKQILPTEKREFELFFLNYEGKKNIFFHKIKVCAQISLQ